MKAGSGKILTGSVEVPGGDWVIQCMDPQGAIFALAGKRSHNSIKIIVKDVDDAKRGRLFRA